MTIVSSGTIGVSTIQTEMVNLSGQTSMNTLINNGYTEKIFRGQKGTPYPNASTPYAHSEWYSYKHFPRSSMTAWFSMNESTSFNYSSRTSLPSTITGIVGTNYNYDNYAWDSQYGITRKYGGVLREGYRGLSGYGSGAYQGAVAISTINSGATNVSYAMVALFNNGDAGMLKSTNNTQFIKKISDTRIGYRASNGNNNEVCALDGFANSGYTGAVNFGWQGGTGGSKFKVIIITANTSTANYYFDGYDGDSYAWSSSRGAFTHNEGTNGLNCTNVGPGGTVSEFAAYNKILSATEMKRIATYWYSYLPNSLRSSPVASADGVNDYNPDPGYFGGVDGNYSWGQIFTPKKFSDCNDNGDTYGARWQHGGGGPSGGTTSDWVMQRVRQSIYHPRKIRWFVWNGNGSTCTGASWGDSRYGGWTGFGGLTNVTSGNYRWAYWNNNNDYINYNNGWFLLTFNGWNAGYAEVELYDNVNLP